MAILHKATLTPSKPELIEAHLPTVDDFAIAPGPIEHLGAYRFDDPDGQVGIESHLVRVADGRTVHLPLTYRNDPLPGADEWFVGTLEHSVLGTRHVYDAVGDPVYVAELARVIATGGEQAPLIVHLPDGETLERDNVVFVRGSGDADAAPAGPVGVPAREGTVTTIPLGEVVVTVHHVPQEGDGEPLGLAGTWPGSRAATVLATLSR